jgi:predicted RNA methylase
VIDQFYTPAHVALSSLHGLNKKGIKKVADFAIGNGSLIRALNFKPKTIIGLDLNKTVIGKLKREYPNWDLKNGDFISPTKPTSKWLSLFEKQLDLILLNPPFSCKGGSRIIIEDDGQVLKCRTALAFVVKALRYLNYNGTLIAILPLSTFKSESDNLVIKHLQKKWSITFGTKFGRNSFEGCFPNSVVVSISRRNTTTKAHLIKPPILDSNFKVEILRGSVRMHETHVDGKYKVIHTTNLKNSLFIKKNLEGTNSKERYAQGIYICIPRVCKPNKSKIVLVKDRKIHILSDCVIGLRAENTDQTILLQKLILSNWSKFEKLYESTCAPYLTIKQISDFLQEYGIKSNTVSNFGFHHNHWIYERNNPIRLNFQTVS